LPRQESLDKLRIGMLEYQGVGTCGRGRGDLSSFEACIFSPIRLDPTGWPSP